MIQSQPLLGHKVDGVAGTPVSQRSHIGVEIWRLPRYWYFLKLYRSATFAFSSGGREVKWRFQPGQKLMCQRQNRPKNDLGFLSYLARKPQFSHLSLAI